MNPVNNNARTIRLTMVITELDIGGAEKAFVQIACGLHRRGWQVNAVSLRDEGPLADQLREAGVAVTALNCGGLADIRAIWRLRLVLQQQKPHVLLSFLHQANLAARLAACSMGIPLVVSGVRVADRRMTVWLPDRFTRCCVDHYICNSAQAASVHAKLCRVSPDRISTILNGVDLPAIREIPPVSRESLEVDDDDCLFCFVGRLTYQKAPEHLIAAFQQLPTDLQAQAAVVIAGAGPLRSVLHSRVDDSGLARRVRLLGWRPDAVAIMKASDAFVLPSRWEGLPNVIMEALAAGCPVIASDVDGNREVITDGSNGQLFECGRIDQLSELMAEAIRSKRMAQPSPQTTQAYSVEGFTWDRAVGEYHALLQKLLSQKAIR